MAEVVIVGAGPAGLTLGCYLAQAGVPCLILDKAHHPRPHVGESLMPATVRILREIGFLDIVETAGFPRSGGVVYHPRVGFNVPLSYADFPQEGVEQGYTYHVDRARFDMLLLKHAENLGCKIVEGAAVDEVNFDADGRAIGVRVRIGDEPTEIPAKIVVDAAGRSTLIGRQLDLRRSHPVLDQFALHAWCVGVDRGRVKTESYTHIYFLPEVRGWAWQAPVNDEITSIGLVAAKNVYQESGLDIEDFFISSLKGNRRLAKATRNAARINDLKGEVNYSYRLDRVCGDGWLALGDAARFIDPVFSSGVSVAMHTARFAAERVESAIVGGDASRTTFLPYEDKLMAGAAIWDDFIRLFYTLLPGFLHLLESKDNRSAMMRMIQGDVNATSHAAVLEEMRALVRSVEASDNHPWHAELAEFAG
jgi:FADH2 O2-dependent halogenase